jgi:hypothetical protein
MKFYASINNNGKRKEYHNLDEFKKDFPNFKPLIHLLQFCFLIL